MFVCLVFEPRATGWKVVKMKPLGYVQLLTCSSMLTIIQNFVAGEYLQMPSKLTL